LTAIADRSDDQERELEALKVIPNLGEADPDRARTSAAELVDIRYPVSYEANAALNGEVKTWSPEELATRCRALTMPALVVHGDRDPRPVEALTTLVDALPDARLEILPGVGHFPWAEHPDLLRTALRGFLAPLA
jgi:pimeloyl-ACP methyl ester carboxylesterase